MGRRIDSVEDLRFPLPDESFVPLWQKYSEEVTDAGSIHPLAAYLPQLQFPIRERISLSPAYQLATAVYHHIPVGKALKCELELIAPDKCKLAIHQTPAGRIPILLAEHRSDFIALVQALVWNNEPVEIAAGTDCIAVSRSQRQAQPTSHPTRERFLLVSADTSGETSRASGVMQSLWRKSLPMIRCEHGSTHYFSRRILGSMRNLFPDEVIAHFYGLACVLGRFRAEWMMESLGFANSDRGMQDLTRTPQCADPPLSSGALSCLLKVVENAASNLEVFAKEICRPGMTLATKASILLTLFAFSLEELAMPDAAEWLLWEFERQSTLRGVEG